MDYTEALRRLRQRRNPEDLMIKEAYAHIKEDEPIRYIIGAMAEIDPDYTRKTYSEAERVQNQIDAGMKRNSLGSEFEYQGSITKNTHIRAYSDIDVLTLEKRFVDLEAPQTPANPYKGSPTDDLCQIRAICEETLRSAFPKAEVDSSGARSIKISGGSLARAVDVVPANWYNTNKYVETGYKVYRGIQILNFPKREREKDTPFIHGALISNQDDKCRGNLRRLVRLCKSLKYDSGREDIPSSYDLESLLFRMPEAQMQWDRGQELQLTASCYGWIGRIVAEPALRDSLFVPDGKRKIFAPGKTTVADAQGLHDELGRLLYDVEQGLTRSFRKLAEARVNYPQS
jgi:hypothetical protein